ncbi:hypothetical protein G7Y79_00007g022770 [Physcia stellaris]|nr:hypothetical protein G7Y79_00007g022770 [Physcia stellaris]
MNADHSDSLIRYLRHYHGLSSFAARQAQLTYITLKTMTISTSLPPSSSNSYAVTLDPPLQSWAEARARLAEMDGEACKGTGCSNITVKRYASPKGTMVLNFAMCLWTIITFSTRSNFVPGSLYHWIFFRHVPGFAKFCYTIQPFLFYLMLVVHFSEVLYLAKRRLEKHTVPMFSQLWWKWVLSDSVEGFPALLRFDAIVQEERLKKDSRKH